MSSGDRGAGDGVCTAAGSAGRCFGAIAGGGLVNVRMTAKMEVKAVKIDPSLMKDDEREVLEDLLVTALGDARRKAEEAMKEKMSALTGGFSLPGLGLG